MINTIVMTKVLRCPVCSGSGKTLTGRYFDDGKGEDDKPCHGCEGKGWVEVKEEITFNKGN